MAGSEYTSVKDFYRDRSIFITGATGFMGKVLVEKLLRSCPDIKNIYLLMRPKRGHNVQERLQELLNGPVIISPSSRYFDRYFEKLKLFYFSAGFWKITAGFAWRAFQDHTRGWRHHGAGAGHLDGRSKYVNTIRIGCLPFSSHRQIRRGLEALGHHKYVGHQKIGSIMQPHAQCGGKRETRSSNCSIRITEPPCRAGIDLQS